MIVLAGVALFGISLVCGPRHGLLIRWRDSRQLQDRIRRDDVLRAIYEIIELTRGRLRRYAEREVSIGRCAETT